MPSADPPVQSGSSVLSSELTEWLRGKGLTGDVREGRGRCLFATRTFKKGELISYCDPYAAVLDGPSEGKRCDVCTKQPPPAAPDLQRCAGCKQTYYCSQKCQKAGWKMHKKECQAVRALSEGGPVPTGSSEEGNGGEGGGKEGGMVERRLTPSMRLVLRILIKRHLQESHAIPTTAIDDFELIKSMEGHRSDMPEEKLVQYAQMAHCVMSTGRLVGVCDESDTSRITDLFCKMACNAHTLCDGEIKAYGIGLYPIAALLNHSCDPSAILLFDGVQGVLHALKDIAVGDEVCISYVELAASTPSRRKELAEQYFFTCNCLRCVDTEGTDADLAMDCLACPSAPDCAGTLAIAPGKATKFRCRKCGLECERAPLEAGEQRAEKLINDGLALKAGNDLVQAKATLAEGLDIYRRILPPDGVRLMRARDHLIQVCLSSRDYQGARDLFLDSLSSYRHNFPEGSPLLGLQLYMLGKLEWFLENADAAISALSEARAMLEVTHGASHPLLKELNGLANEAAAEAAYMKDPEKVAKPMLMTRRLAR
eukprot:jgi/Mesvir1/3122/Mv05562-RA.1